VIFSPLRGTAKSIAQTGLHIALRCEFRQAAADLLPVRTRFARRGARWAARRSQTTSNDHTTNVSCSPCRNLPGVYPEFIRRCGWRAARLLGARSLPAAAGGGNNRSARRTAWSTLPQFSPRSPVNSLPAALRPSLAAPLPDTRPTDTRRPDTPAVRRCSFVLLACPDHRPFFLPVAHFWACKLHEIWYTI